MWTKISPHFPCGKQGFNSTENQRHTLFIMTRKNKSYQQINRAYYFYY